MPHGMCLLWQPGLMTLHVASDGLIALCYFAIPFAIFWFVRRRLDLEPQHKALAVLFALFIAACGVTHLMSILVLWRPYYVAEGVAKAITAVLSVVTACALPFVIRQLLRIPSPKVLKAAIDAHERTLSELRLVRARLAEQVEATADDLRETNRRFQAALSDSPVTVFEQDAELRYTWVFNPPLGLSAQAFDGRNEFDFFSAESARKVRALKRAALDAGEPRRKVVQLTTAHGSGWFDMRIEPSTLRDGRPGLVATSTDITALKTQEQHLRLVMRELNHRAKNLLTIVIGLARQTARGFDLPPAFLSRFEERLAALASAHDVLADHQWRGADLLAVVQGQLSRQLQTYAGRIVLDGPPCVLSPEGAHYIGMALHELGSNAVKYGALSREGDRVFIRWNVLNDEGGPRLDLTWREEASAVVEPKVLGFGAAILKTLAPRAIDGAASLTFNPDGVQWTLTAPLPAQTLIAVEDLDGADLTPLPTSAALEP